jgi:hypothetical protein
MEYASCVEGVDMGVEHLQGRRTGRPRGSKTTPPWVRDARWVYRNLDSPDAVPPSPLAGLLLTLGREHPDRLAVCLARMSSNHGAERPNAEPDKPHGKAISPAALVVAEEDSATEPVRAQRVFVPAARLMQCLVGENRVRITNLEFDCVDIIAAEFDRKQNGVWLTISSGMFPPVPSGTRVPEFDATWRRDPRCRD